MKAIFEDGYCDGQCPFLLSERIEDFVIFHCKKYNEELDYCDGVLQLQRCEDEVVQ